MNNSLFGLFTILIILLSSYFLSIKINKTKISSYINIFSFIYFLFQLQLTTLLLGTFGLLKPLFLFSLNIIISTIVLFFTFKTSICKKIYCGIKKHKILTKIKSFGFPPLFFLFIFLINSLTILYRIIVLPQSVWDVNTYHLIAPIYWYQNEIIPKFIITRVDRVNNLFLGNKIFDYWNILLSKSLLYTELTQFIFAFVLLYTIYLIMRLIKIPKQNSLIFSILAVSFPTILIQMRTTHDHMSLLALTMILIYMIVDLIISNRRLQLIDIINFFILSSLIISVKINGFIYIFISLFTLIISKNIPSLNNLKGINIRKLFSKLLLLLFIVIACVFVGGYWGIKNFVLYQNFLGEKLKYVGIKTDSANNLFFLISESFDKLYSNFLNAPKRFIDIAENYSVDSTNISGYGIQFFSFALPAYFLCFIFSLSKIKFNQNKTIHKAIKFLIFFSLITQIVIYTLYFSKYNYRLLTIFPIIGIILAANFWSQLKLNKIQKKAFNFLLFFILIFNYFITPTVEATTANRFIYAFQSAYSTHASDYLTYLDNDWSIINLLPNDKTVVYYTHEDGFVLPYYDLNLRTKVMSLDEFDYDLENGVLSFPMKTIVEMNDKKVNYLHIGKTTNVISVIDSDYFKHIYGGLYEFIYEK